ncbi:hypothetical protein [Plesiocystis pacifica]|uniref:hypothetical protein n=1 Tax=Plesiocystis pacifica TaxID=191768 RepID=UPI0012F93F7E|nr:hypothetical protein [Plesiocystis pacifica]
MQKVAAYRLEHNITDDDARSAEIDEIIGLLRKWLVEKRADDPSANEGEFRSERDDSSGRFEWQQSEYERRSWRMLRLSEELAQGRQFETSISVTDTGRSVVVYTTLASGLISSAVTPVRTEARCPRPIRGILDLHTSWYHGTTRIQGLRRTEGHEAGRQLADEIRSSSRTLPLIVISEDDGEQFLPKLDKKLSRSLLGLANVTVIDEGASWGLTDVLGKGRSCYWGAIRIYWPRYDENRHQIWRVRRLLDSGATTERFEAQIRSHVMRVSALSAVRPKDIDQIRRGSDRARMQHVQEQLKSREEWEAYAEMYASDNTKLLQKNERLEEENSRLRDELQNAQALLGALPEHDEEILPDRADEEEDPGPTKGEIRYYKKIGSSRKMDKMVETSACGHSAWQSAHKADKAKKGIERYVGRRDWKSVQHCGSCTGGGMWKVQW